MAKRKDEPAEFFGPIPIRALRDERLEARHLRALGIIAAHDRFNRNGVGCYVSQRRLASLVGAHETVFSVSVSLLEQFGYLRRFKPVAGDKRVSAMSVIYNEDDRAIFRTPDALPKDKASLPPSPRDALPGRRGDTLSGTSPKPNNVNGLVPTKYIPLKGRDLAEARTDSVETALPVGAQLQRFERDELPKLRQLTKPSEAIPILQDKCTWLTDLAIDYDSHNGDPIGGHAQRLGEEVAGLIQDFMEWEEQERKGPSRHGRH